PRRPSLRDQPRGTGIGPTAVSRSRPRNTATRSVTGGKTFVNLYANARRPAIAREPARMRTAVRLCVREPSSTGDTYPPVHVRGRLDAKEGENRRREIDDVEFVRRDTGTVHVEQRIRVGVHAGERAAPEHLAPRHGTLRVVAIVEWHAPVGRRTQTPA